MRFRKSLHFLISCFPLQSEAVSLIFLSDRIAMRNKSNGCKHSLKNVIGQESQSPCPRGAYISVHLVKIPGVLELVATQTVIWPTTFTLPIMREDHRIKLLSVISVRGTKGVYVDTQHSIFPFLVSGPTQWYKIIRGKQNIPAYYSTYKPEILEAQHITGGVLSYEHTKSLH